MLIKGDLVELRAVEREDVPRYVPWFNDEEVVAYFGRYEPMALAEEEHWYESQGSNPEVRNYAMYYQGEHVGGAGYAHLNFKDRNAEVGLFIGRKDLWDKGLGADTLRALLRHGFDQLNLHRIYLRVFAENARAVHCYENVGFRHEGMHRHAHFRHGHYQDILWMSVLEDEYRAAQAGAPIP